MTERVASVVKQASCRYVHVKEEVKRKDLLGAKLPCHGPGSGSSSMRLFVDAECGRRVWCVQSSRAHG